MSAVTRIIYTFFLLPMLVILSACSDSGSESEISIDDRRLNIDTPFSVLEGGDGDVSIIEVSFVSTVTGTISYSTFNVTAASRSDYIPVAGDIEVTEGVEYTINISIEGDDQIEGDELIGLSLTLNGEDLVTYYGRIENDDLPPVTIKTTSVLEGDTGTSLLRFTISLDEEVVDPYTFALVTPVVDVSLNDPENDIFYAIPDIDFEAIDQNITFTEGVSEISIDVVVLADNVIELDERVFIQLNPLQNGLSAEGLIRTDDAVDINGFDLSSVSSEILEGTSASVTDIEWGLVEYLVTVDRPENIIDEQVVQIKLIGKDEQLSDGSTDWASLGEDYCANPVLIDGVCDSVGSYVLEPGIDSTSLMVSFYVRKDLDVEESEEIEIQLQNDQGVVFGNFRHTIIQDDNPSLTVSYLDTSGILQTANLADLVLAAKNDGFTIEILEPADSDSQSVSSIWFNLDFPLKDEFKPSYEFSEVRVSQIGVSDYYVENAGAGVITFAENSTATTNIDVTALHDDDYEGREVLNLEIEDFGVIPITIIDNDLPILKITETTGADILRNDAHFSAITLSESLSANSSDATTTYNFNFALEGGIEALDDLNFSYEINDVFFKNNETAINNIAACTYLKDDNRNRKAIINGEEGATEVLDYQILIGGSELAPNTDYIFEKTKPKLEFSMVVNNDEFVECLEFIFLKFTLSPITNQADDETVLSSTIDVNFEITNTDKATLKVVGWNTDEGSSDQAPLATTNKNFSLALDQAIVTSEIQYTLTSSTNDALSCGDDLQGITVPYVNTVSFNGLDTDLNKAIGVLIQQDNIVEPEEACQLSITNMTSEDSAVIDVEYFNETGKNTGLYAVDLVNTYASGVIQNDDNLIVTVTTPADSTIEEPVTTGDTLSIGTYSWNKVIAANVGKIAVTATQQDCAADDECIDAADTSFGTHTNATPATKEMIIHTGAETEALAFEERSLPIIVNGDNEVENPENLTFNLAITSGNEYIDLANSNLSNRSIEVTSLDTLSVFLEENNALNTCGDDVISPVNSERDCERVFNIKFSEDISEDVMDLNVNLSIDTDDSDGSINTVNIKGAGSIDYVDAIISIKENSSAAGYTEATPVENNVSINILQGGVVQEPSIKITFVNDDVVEIDETLLLSLQAVGSNGFYGVDTSRDTISQFVNNDDKLTITYTQFDSSELNEAPDTQVQPFTYTWDKDIAPNVPTIQFAFDAFCDVAADHNCAESNNDFDIPSNNDLVTIHTENTNNYTEVPAIALSLGVYYKLDTRVEADEVLEIEVSKLGNSRILTNTEGQAFIEFLKLGATTESNQINLSSIIRNDDFLNLTVTNTTDTDAACSGFSEESGCNVFSISWGTQVVDADTGNIIVPLNLPLLDSHTRYAADGSTNPKDYSVKLDGSEITYSDGANSLNLGAGLAADDSIPLIVDIATDNFVEPEEALTVSLNAAGSPYVAKINDNAAVEQILSHTIPIDDLLTVTVTGSGTSDVEAGDTGGKSAPFTFTTDNAVAANTPTLTMTLSESSCTGSCATLNSDFTLPSLKTLHVNSTSNSTSAVTASADLGVAIQTDNVVENHEKLNLQMSSNNTELVKFSGANTQDLTYTISNTDTLDLVVTDITDKDATCSGISGEDGCKLYDISWVNGTDSNLGDVILAMNTEGSTSEMFYTQQTKAGDISIIENPKDYSLTISDVALTSTTQIPLGSGLAEVSSKQFKVTIEDDNYVELEDTLALNLSASAGSAIINSLKIGSNAAVLNSANAGYASLLTHTIPTTADPLNVTVSTGTSGPEAGDTDGVANPFTYTTSNNIVASVPDILLSVGQVTCGATETCATITDDFTLPNAMALHNTGTYTAQNQSNSSLGVVVQPDNIIESDELIKLSLTAKDNLGAASPYVSYTTNNPTHIITNTDVLNLTITDNTADTSCTGFSGETASCRSYKIAWQNILQSGAAISIAMTEADDNVAERVDALENDDDATLITDPQDYSITAGGNEVANLITLANEDSDGDANTNSMTVTVNITEDDFVEPSEKLNIYFSKPSGVNAINSIGGFNVEGTITHTTPIDDVLVISFSGSGTSGGEPKYETGNLVSGTVSNPLKYITNLAIAANTELIQLNVSERGCGSGLDCATVANGDFTITNPLTLHSKGSYKLAGENDLGVYIEDDEIVEVDESIKVRVTENSSYIDSIISRDSTYTIDNNDKTVLSFVAKSNFNGDEGHSGSGNVEYSIQSSLAISSDIGKLYVDLSLDYTSTADSSDATVPSTLEFKGSSAISSGASKNFNVAIIGEEIVELDETVIPKIILHTGSSDYTEIDSTKFKGATYTINNDDYINLEVIGGTCTELSGITNCAMTEGDTGSSSFTFKPTAEYETQGITDPAVILSVIDTSTASGSDYTFVASVALDSSVSDVGVTGLEKTFLAISGDKIIERNESVLLAATIPSYVALNFPTEFTINNDDYVSVTSKNYLGLNQVDSLQEGGTLKLEFCVPSGYTYQNQNGLSDITLTTTPTVSGTDSEFYKEAVCDDLKLLDDNLGAVNCDLTSMSVGRSISLDGKNTGECTTLDLITANTDSLADQNVWFDLGYASSDERCEGNCLPNHSALILNNDLINTLDTGLDECVESGIDERWDVRCIGFSESPTVDYLKQDAVETDFYPDLTYTFIDTNSAAVVERPASGEICVQDNSTGLIWSSAIESNAAANDYTINYSGDDSAQTSWDCGILNADSKTWQLPTVQELMSIMDLNPVSKSKPLNENRIFDFKKIGSNYYNANSRYWSSDLCSISAPNDGAWTVNFITGHFVCENTGSETNAKMHVYK
jgi:hypothetical protein